VKGREKGTVGPMRGVLSGARFGKWGDTVGGRRFLERDGGVIEKNVKIVVVKESKDSMSYSRSIKGRTMSLTANQPTVESQVGCLFESAHQDHGWKESCKIGVPIHLMAWRGKLTFGKG